VHAFVAHAGVDRAGVVVVALRGDGAASGDGGVVAGVVREAYIEGAGIVVVALRGDGAAIGNDSALAVGQPDGGCENAYIVGACISVVAIGIAGAAFGDRDVDVLASVRDIAAEIAGANVVIDDAVSVDLAALGGPGMRALLGDGAGNGNAIIDRAEVVVVAVGDGVAALVDFLAEALVSEAGVDGADLAVIAISIAFAAVELQIVHAPSVLAAFVERTVDLVIAIVLVSAAAVEGSVITGTVDACIGRTPVTVIASGIGSTAVRLEVVVACASSVACYVNACVVLGGLDSHTLFRALATPESPVVAASAVHT
jgi:hypothetical protein